MRRFIVLLVLLCSPGMALAAEGKPWIGVNLEVVSPCPALPGLKAKVGILLTRVQPGSPGARAGLKDGDIVVAVDGSGFGERSDRALPALLAVIQRHKPGEVLSLRLIRDVVEIEARSGDRALRPEDAADPRAFLEKAEPGTTVTVQGRKARKLLTVDVVLGTRKGTALPPLPSNDSLRPDLAGAAPVLRASVKEVVEAAGTGANFQDLLGRLGRLHDTWDGWALTLTALCHRDPFCTEAASRKAVASLATPAQDGPASLPRLLAALGRLGDRKVPGDPPPPLATGLSPTSHARQVESVLLAVREETLRAFAKLTAREKDLIKRQRRGLTDRFVTHIYLHGDEDTERMERNLALVRAARKVDVSALIRAAALLARLTDPAFLGAMKRDLLKAYGDHVDAPFLLRHHTELGDVVFGGTASTWHRLAKDCAVFDLGGDDFYTASCGAGNSFVKPVGIVVDFAGNDAYASTTEQAQASGSLGVAILADLAGDDTYTATRWGQATGFFGVGVLSDWSGNDTYRGEELCQGVGCVGVGLLVDWAGNDRYEAKRYGQGVGMPGGVGAVLDLAGDDHYYCKGRYPSGYGTHGIFEGWGQGCGVGFRQYAAGGLGLLVDGAGRDRYEAGNFSQGGGYYYGLGLLCDQGADDDRYVGSRYDQGFSAHQAVGVFLESGGDDAYDTRNGVAQGLAWDECVTLFVDSAGNDTYRGGSGFSQGATAHNSICFFFDRAGRDTYRYKPGQARAGKNDYHGGTSFSFFVDEGGAEDEYDKAKRNGSVRTGKEHFAFLDLPATLKDAFTGGAWRKLWVNKPKPVEKKPGKKE